MTYFSFQVALKYSEKYSTNKVRILTLEQNRGKGGAIRLVCTYFNTHTYTYIHTYIHTHTHIYNT